MQLDEAGTLAALASIREATQNQIAQHRGRIANTAGDSVLAEFGSAVEAVSCAMALQQELSSRAQGGDLQIRVGVHFGDVVDKGGDLIAKRNRSDLWGSKKLRTGWRISLSSFR
jgi:adenylate cyclase